MKEESDRGMRPWQWSNMKSKYSYAQSLINNLCDEKRYEFTLTGKFEDVIGNKLRIVLLLRFVYMNLEDHFALQTIIHNQKSAAVVSIHKS